MLTLGTGKFPTNGTRRNLPIYFFRMKPRLVPEVVNSAQTSERREIKKVAALNMEPMNHQSALCQGEGGL